MHLAGEASTDKRECLSTQKGWEQNKHSSERFHLLIDSSYYQWHSSKGIGRNIYRYRFCDKDVYSQTQISLFSISFQCFASSDQLQPAACMRPAHLNLLIKAPTPRQTHTPTCPFVLHANWLRWNNSTSILMEYKWVFGENKIYSWQERGKMERPQESWTVRQRLCLMCLREPASAGGAASFNESQFRSSWRPACRRLLQLSAPAENENTSWRVFYMHPQKLWRKCRRGLI